MDSTLAGGGDVTFISCNGIYGRSPMAHPVHSAAYRALLERLRTGRERAGLRQADVARHLKKPQSYVSKCESGERRVDVVELAELARLYGLPVDFFIAVPTTHGRKRPR